MTPTCRWATPSDVAQIEAFLSTAFGPTSFQSIPERFEWLFLDNPQGFHVSIAVDAGEVVGFRGYLPFRLAGFESPTSAAFGMDFIVRPDHRCQGIGSRFLQMAMDRFDLVVAVGPTPANRRLHQRVASRLMARPYAIVAVQRVDWVTGSVRERVRDWGSFLYRAGFSIGRHDLMPVNLTRVVTIAEECEESGPTETGQLRTRSHLLWRYGQGPYRSDYEFYQVAGEREPGAAIVRRNGRGARLIDLICRAAARRALLRSIVASEAFGRLDGHVFGAALRADCRASGLLVRKQDGEVHAIAKSPELLNRVANREWVGFAGDSDADLMRMPGVSYPNICSFVVKPQ